MDQNIFNQSIGTFIAKNLFWIITFYIWSLLWKAIALWKTARTNDKVWFIVFMIVNTLGILEILYIFHFSKYPSLSKPTKHKKDE